MTGMEIPLMIAGAGISFIGSMRQASAMTSIGQQEAQAERAAAERNAQVAERNAKIVRNNSNVNAARVERETRIRQGAARAAGGGNGLELMGSALDIMEDNFMEGELDRLTILHEGELEAQSFMEQADFYRFGGENRAQAAAFQGNAAASSTRAGAVGSLLGSAGKIAGAGFGGGGSYGPGSSPGSVNPGRGLRDSSGFIG